MPMRRRSRANPLAEPRTDHPAQASALPQELEARIAALESAAQGADFDLASWIWMILIGIVIPALLLILGWLA